MSNHSFLPAAAQRGHERHTRGTRFRPQHTPHQHQRNITNPVRVHRGRRRRHRPDGRDCREPALATAAHGAAAVCDAATGRLSQAEEVAGVFRCN